jgi:hypothetical protein
MEGKARGIPLFEDIEYCSLLFLFAEAGGLKIEHLPVAAGRGHQLVM